MVKRKITKKEKREIGLILGSVLIVAIVGVMITNTAFSSVGEATRLGKGGATYPGIISLLSEYSEAVERGNLQDCKSACNLKDMDEGPHRSLH